MTYAYITGGGTKWIYDSLKRGGASSWFLGGRIPYNQKDFDEILGGQPFDGKYVSERTAAQLSAAAYSHAVKLTGDEDGSIGLGVTAKLGTAGQRKGRENKIIISITKSLRGKLSTFNYVHTFPNWMSRLFQERSCSKLINDSLKYKNRNFVDVSHEDHFYKLEDLKAGKDKSIVLYSGSFNPMHDSHISVAELSSNLFKDHTFYLEIPIKNFSKGNISPYELHERILKINDTPTMRSKRVVFSKASTFVEKANILTNNGYTSIIFPMGDDTYERITSYEKDTLFNMGVSILLFKRHKDTFPDNHSVIHKLSNDLPKLQSISSSEIRKNAIQ